MPDYSNGKIYKMESPSGLLYIGSTCQPLCERKAGHKIKYKLFKSGKEKFRTSSFDLFDEAEDDIEIYLLEKYPCTSKEELHAREGDWIKQHDCVNKRIAGRTDKEYYQDNKQKINEYCQNRRNTRFVCECGGKYSVEKRARHFRTNRHEKWFEKSEITRLLALKKNTL